MAETIEVARGNAEDDAEASVVHFGPARPPGFPVFEVVFVSFLVGGIL